MTMHQVKRNKITSLGKEILFQVLLLFVISGSCLCCSGGSKRLKAKVRSDSQLQELVRFDSKGKLKILQFADLHYGEAPDTEWGPRQDTNSTKVIRDILEWESPDFVVFTGDQITGENMFPNATDYISILLQPLVEKNLRWASVYGNHDLGANVTRLEILHAEQSYGKSLCYTKPMKPELPGVTNYFIPVYSPRIANNEDRMGEENEKPIMIWWFLDSQGGQDKGGQQPHHIDQTVVEWFKTESRRLQTEWGILPSFVFFHIPPTEFIGVQETVSSNHLCTGLLDDDVTPQDMNTGIMAALSEVGGVSTIFVGHDHGNAWCCFYQEIRVCYNRHTGYGGYGRWTRGARVIELDMGRLMNSTNYVRLETGEVVDRFPDYDNGQAESVIKTG